MKRIAFIAVAAFLLLLGGSSLSQAGEKGSPVKATSDKKTGVVGLEWAGTCALHFRWHGFAPGTPGTITVHFLGQTVTKSFVVDADGQGHKPVHLRKYLASHPQATAVSYTITVGGVTSSGSVTIKCKCPGGGGGGGGGGGQGGNGGGGGSSAPPATPVSSQPGFAG